MKPRIFSGEETLVRFTFIVRQGASRQLISVTITLLYDLAHQKGAQGKNARLLAAEGATSIIPSKVREWRTTAGMHYAVTNYRIEM